MSRQRLCLKFHFCFRIHPETGQQNIRHHCPTCSKGFAHRAALAKHQQMCNEKSEEVEVKEIFIKEEKVCKEIFSKNVFNKDCFPLTAKNTASDEKS
jgi:hypothetical protein